MTSRPPLLILHAAVLVRHELAFLLAGPSGAGKSTLAIALAEAGWIYYSDNLAPVDTEDGRVHAFQKPITIRDPGRWSEFSGQLPLPLRQEVPIGAFQVPPTLYQLGDGRPKRLGALIFSQYEPECAGCDLTRISVAEGIVEVSRVVDRINASMVGALTKTVAPEATIWRLTYSEQDAAIAELTGVADHVSRI